MRCLPHRAIQMHGYGFTAPQHGWHAVNHDEQIVLLPACEHCGDIREIPIEPTKLRRLVRGELDWIVMKALDKDRSRRYAAAATFAEDIRRYLAHERVTARPPTPVYLMRKFARRNRASVLAGGLLLLMLPRTA